MISFFILLNFIIRSNRDNFEDYLYVRKCPDNTSIKDFIDTRIFGLLKSGEVTVVINGYGEIPNVRIYIYIYIGTVRVLYNV